MRQDEAYGESAAAEEGISERTPKVSVTTSDEI
jgi:hypothetical protein